MEEIETVDYIVNICNYLDTNNIDPSNYNDDFTYFYGGEDVYTANIKGENIKFIQLYHDNGTYSNFTMFHNNNVITEYDNVVEYLKKLYDIV